MKKPIVDIDPHSGFCFGVTSAISKAEEELALGGKPLHCLGDIVHNSAEVQRLAQKGLRTINHDDLQTLSEARVLFRAHGEPPQTYETVRQRNITLIDATCPVVLKLQQRIKSEYDSALARGSKLQIVIYGQRGHAEVNGLVGQTQGTAIVLEDATQIDKIDPDIDIALYSQTTKSPEGFNKIVDLLKSYVSEGVDVRYYDTICRQVANRVSHLRDFASTHDVVLFVASSNSSNGKVLFSHCKSVNQRSHLVAHPDEIRPEWIVNVNSVGICGATSTPRWLMEAIAEKADSLTSEFVK